MKKVRMDLWNGNRKPLVIKTEKKQFDKKSKETKTKKKVRIEPSANQKSEPIRYWMVDVTLTSGNVQSFYLKAKTKFDALQKAEELKEITLIPKLQTNKLLLKD